MKFQRFILSMLLFSILLFLPNIGTAQMEDDWGCEESWLILQVAGRQHKEVGAILLQMV